MRIRCDGCGKHGEPSGMATPQADGHEARYCNPCAEIYEDFVRIVQIEENRLNAVLDAFISETRAKLPLDFTPQDLPARKPGLGGLLLG